jgi:hypothetical protein
VSDWTLSSLAAPVAANLAALGWAADHPRVREVAPVTARGHNAVVVAPPVPAWSGPALAGAISHLASAPEGQLLLVAPAESVTEWSRHLASLVPGTGLGLLASRGSGRASRALREAPPALLVLSPDTALALLARGDLKPPGLTAMVLAWPERWADEAVLLPLMQDLAREAQRIILSADPTTAAALAERYAWKAPVCGPPSGSETAGPVRTVAVSWERRPASVAELVELLDPADLVIWTADRGLHPALGAALAGVAPQARIVCQSVDTDGAMVIAADLPDAATLNALVAAGELVLLVPPGADSWLAGAAAPRRPILLPGIIEDTATVARQRRAAIARTIQEDDPAEAALVLAPLFERHEAPAVAAALYALWTRREATPQPAAAPTGAGGTEKIWIGIGKRDEVGVNELVAFLTRELAVTRATIGKIEVREGFSLVEVPREDAARIAEAIGGRTLRRRRLVARVDRGAPAAGSRPGRGRGPA